MKHYGFSRKSIWKTWKHFLEVLKVDYNCSLADVYRDQHTTSRKNSLFFGSHKGAERGAILYTIALTCRMHKVNLFEYLTDVINRTAEWQPNTPIEKYRELLPDRWEKANG